MSKAVNYKDFEKLDLRVSTVEEVEKIPGSDSLYKMQVNIGGKTIQIVSNLIEFYNTDELLGKRIIVCTNIAPATLYGELSEGMLLAAETENGDLALLTTDKEIADGAKIT